MKRRRLKIKLVGYGVICLLSVLSVYAADGQATQPNETQLFDLIQKGGVIMIPLALLSVLAFALALDRFINLSRPKVIPKTFMRELKDAQGGKHDYNKAIDFCEHSQTPIGRILKIGFTRLKVEHRLGEVEKFITDVAAREVGKMKRGLRGLKVIAGVCPMLGLTGTVYGMIRAFQQIALNPNVTNKSVQLSKGIYEAMVTTAAGLTIAIPVLLVYHFLNNRVDAHANEIEETAEEFLAEYLDTKLDVNSDSGNDK